MKKDTFRVVTVEAPNGAKGTVHLSISDATGDSAIFEYVKGKLVIHRGKKYQVMTNSPTYDKQLALNEYWAQIGGTVMLPGTNRAADRFARDSFYVNATKQSADAREAVAAVFSAMRNVSVPCGIGTKDQPNISSTIWRTASDQKNRVYYHEDTNSPGALWVKLDKIDFEFTWRAEVDDGRQAGPDRRPDGELREGRAVPVPRPARQVNSKPHGTPRSRGRKTAAATPNGAGRRAEKHPHTGDEVQGLVGTLEQRAARDAERNCWNR